MSSTVTELDVSTASMARTYDYWRGGREHLEPDRCLAAAIDALYPPGNGPRQLVAANRTFQERAVSNAVHDGCQQVIDAGSGFPCAPGSPALHEVARSARESARVAYVDLDPVVVSHARDGITRTGLKGVTAAHCNLTRPGEVMANPDVRSVIDDCRPVVAVFGLVLHFVTASDARRVIAGWADWLPSGSRFVVTVAHWDDALLYEKVRAVYGPAAVFNHSEDELYDVLWDLDILGSGVVVARGWGPEDLEHAGPARVLAAVARKP